MHRRSGPLSDRRDAGQDWWARGNQLMLGDEPMGEMYEEAMARLVAAILRNRDTL